MFEQKLEDMKSSIVIDENYKSILDRSGCMMEFNIGNNEFTYLDAVAQVDRMYSILPNVKKHLRKRYISVINQIIFSFGPEFEERHKRRVVNG